MKFLKVFTLRLYKIMFWLPGKCFNEKYEAEAFRGKALSSGDCLAAKR